MSLLETQSAFLENDALQAVHDMKHRVFAMSLIHQKLYLRGNVTSIQMGTYIPELISYLNESFDTRSIRFDVDIDELTLNIGQAVPLGLILNEAITNCIKYAFPDKKDSLIRISIKKLSDTSYRLQVADNGIGLPNPGLEKTGSLGLRLMKGLSEDIGGTFTIETKDGVTIRVLFTIAGQPSGMLLMS